MISARISERGRQCTLLLDADTRGVRLEEVEEKRLDHMTDVVTLETVEQPAAYHLLDEFLLIE